MVVPYTSPATFLVVPYTSPATSLDAPYTSPTAPFVPLYTSLVTPPIVLSAISTAVVAVSLITLPVVSIVFVITLPVSSTTCDIAFFLVLFSSARVLPFSERVPEPPLPPQSVHTPPPLQLLTQLGHVGQTGGTTCVFKM